MDFLELVTTFGSIVTSIVLIITLYFQLMDNRPHPVLTRVKENADWHVSVRASDKPIGRSSVKLNGKKLRLKERDSFFRTISLGGAENYSIPKSKNLENGTIEVRDEGRFYKQLWKGKFSEIDIS